MTLIITLKRLIGDKQFLVALLAAPALWLIMLWWYTPTLDLAWPLRLPTLFLTNILLYPIVEEIVFRGLIQEQAHRYLPNKTVGPISSANLLTSILFSAMHLYNHAPLWAAAVFLPSLVFGYFKDRHATLLTCILLHIFYNSGYFWIFKI